MYNNLTADNEDTVAAAVIIDSLLSMLVTTIMWLAGWLTTLHMPTRYIIPYTW